MNTEIQDAFLAWLEARREFDRYRDEDWCLEKYVEAHRAHKQARKVLISLIGPYDTHVLFGAYRRNWSTRGYIEP